VRGLFRVLGVGLPLSNAFNVNASVRTTHDPVLPSAVASLGNRAMNTLTALSAACSRSPSLAALGDGSHCMRMGGALLLNEQALDQHRLSQCRDLHALLPEMPVAPSRCL
jgi:hypothetical protein